MSVFDLEHSPITEPESLLVDTFVQWKRLLDYPSTEFNVFYEVQGTVTTTVTGIYDAANEWWSFQLGTGDYANLTSGDTRWDLIVQRISDSQRVVLSSGVFVVHLTTDDRRTHAEIMLSKIESLLEGRAASDIESYSIKSRSITKMSPKELREWRDYYAAEVARTGGSVTDAARPKKNTVRVRFI